MSDDRLHMPLDVQREVRQRCGFGCVVCGLPIYELHHMVDYATHGRHVATEITCLCGVHHAEVTKGLLTAEQVARADSDPVNVRNGITSPYGLHFEGGGCDILVGGNCFTTHLRSPDGSVLLPISIDDLDLVGFIISPDGQLLLWMNVFDEYNLRTLTITDNVLVMSSRPWDIDFRGGTLTIREGLGEILLEVVLKPPSRIEIPRARLLCNGLEVLVRPTGIFIANSRTTISNCRLEGQIGLQLGRNDRNLGACASCDPRLLKRYALSEEELELRRQEFRQSKSHSEQLRALLDDKGNVQRAAGGGSGAAMSKTEESGPDEA